MAFEKLLVLGPGSIGLKHIKAARKINPFLEIGVFRTRLKKIYQKSDFLEFQNIQEAISWKPDLIIVATPANMHFSNTKELITLGIPIILEKPIGHKKDSIEDWLNLEKKRISNILVGYQLRFDPSYKLIKDSISEGILGKIFSAHFFCGSWLPNWRKKDYRDSVSVSNDLGGGIVAELSHELDLCLSLLGQIDLIFCSKSNSNLLDIQCEDNLHLMAKSQNCSKIVIDLDFCTFSERRFLLIRGNEGELFWDITKDKLIKKDKKGENLLWQGNNNTELRLENQIKDIINNSKVYKSSGCSLKEGISVLEFMQLIDKKCINA